MMCQQPDLSVLLESFAELHRTEGILLMFRCALKPRTAFGTERTAHTALNDLPLRQFAPDQATQSGLPTSVN
jgi:hypothetical protein